MLDAINGWLAWVPIPVADALRLFDILAGVPVLALFLSVAYHVRNTRKWGMLALVAWGLNSIFRSFDSFGNPASYSSILNTAAVVFGVIFHVKTWRETHGHTRFPPPHLDNQLPEGKHR